MSGDRRSGLWAWRPAARLAWREVRRRPGRTALVAALVAVPVAGMLLGATFLRTDELSDAETWRIENGRADVVLHVDTATPAPELPEGSEVVRYQETWRVAGTAGGDLCRCRLSDMPFTPLTDGIVRVTDGRAPAAAGEVLLSPEAAEALGTRLRGRVELSRPVRLDAQVVGIGDQSAWLDDPIVVAAPGALGPVDPMYGAVRRLVDLPDDLAPAEVAAFEAQAGPHLLSPAYPAARSTVASGDNANVGVRWTWAAGAAGLTVLGIVIAAAFAASARRQLVLLGQLAANGATPALLRRVLFLQGTVTGVVGAAAGLALGAAVLVLARPRAHLLFDHAVLGWDVRLLDVVPMVLIAVAAATIAALVPALGASRVSVLTALAGRRPLGRVSRRLTAAGLGAAVAGTALLAYAAAAGPGAPTTTAALTGPVLLLLGVCAATPALVTVLRPVAGASRGPWRLAARSLFRQRTRTSALVSAICAISAVAVVAATAGLTAEREARADRRVHQLPDDLVRVRASATAGYLEVVPSAGAVDEAAGWAQAALPGTERFAIAEAVVAGEAVKPTFTPRDFRPSGDDVAVVPEGLVIPWKAFVVDAAFEAAYEPDAATRRLLDEVGAVYAGPSDGRVTIDGGVPAIPAVPDGGLFYPRPFSFEAGALGPEHSLGLGHGILLLSPDKADELGLVPAVMELVLRAPGPLDEAQRAAAERLGLRAAAASEDAGVLDPSAVPLSPEESAAAPFLSVDYRQLGRYVGAGVVETVPASVALLFGLLVVAVGLALAAVETRDERDVLAVLGAAPRTLRRTSAYKAFLLTLLGGTLAVPVGLLPVVVVTRLGADPVTVLVPWRTIALLVVAVPLVTAAATHLAPSQIASVARTMSE